jgi:hypothetical protein
MIIIGFCIYRRRKNGNIVEGELGCLENRK